MDAQRVRRRLRRTQGSSGQSKAERRVIARAGDGRDVCARCRYFRRLFDNLGNCGFCVEPVVYPIVTAKRGAAMSSKNTISLSYDGAALEAATFYAETLPDSDVGSVHRAP